MNRRGFFGKIGALAAGFMILPPATTYERIWKAGRRPLVCVEFSEGCNLRRASIFAFTPEQLEAVMANFPVVEYQRAKGLDALFRRLQKAQS